MFQLSPATNSAGRRVRCCLISIKQHHIRMTINGFPFWWVAIIAVTLIIAEESASFWRKTPGPIKLRRPVKFMTFCVKTRFKIKNWYSFLFRNDRRKANTGRKKKSRKNLQHKHNNVICALETRVVDGRGGRFMDVLLFVHYRVK